MPLIYADLFSLPPEKAIRWFRAKGLRTTFRWSEMLKSEHDMAFTVAKLMDLDLLADVQTALTLAMTSGMTLREFTRDLEPILQARGWWGTKEVINPETGEKSMAQLGSARRLETIFRTNLQSAYAYQRDQTIQATKKSRPYLLYSAIRDRRTRPEHAAWNGIILPINHSFWETHQPPNGYNCRCTVIQLDDRDLKARNLSVSADPLKKYYDWVNPDTGIIEKIPEGIDPGFNYKPADRMAHIESLKEKKLAGLPANIRDNAGKF